MSSNDVGQKRTVLADDQPIPHKKTKSMKSIEMLANVLRQQSAQPAQPSQPAQPAHAVQSVHKTTKSAQSTTKSKESLAQLLKQHAVLPAQPVQEAHAVQSAQSTAKSAPSTTKSAPSTTKSAESLAQLLKLHKADDKHAMKVPTSTISSDEDEPLYKRLTVGVWATVVGDNIKVEKGSSRDKDINGTARPVKPKALSEDQVKEARRKRNAVYKASSSTGKSKTQVMKKAERKKKHLKQTNTRDDQEVSTSSSEEKSDDDWEHGDISDSEELMRNHAPKSIHTGPLLEDRESQPTVKFNPRRGGADTLRKDKIVDGLRLKIGFKKLVDGYVEGYVSWNEKDYRKANKNQNSRKYQDGSRHPDNHSYVGWTLHDPIGFLDKFHSLVLASEGPPIGPEAAFDLLKENMDAAGNMLFGKQVVIFMTAEQKIIEDNFFQVEIMPEFEEELEEKDKEGPKKKKKNRHNKSQNSSDGDFVPGVLTDDDSEELSIYSDNASVVKCDDRSDVSDGENGAVPSCDNSSQVSANSKHDEGVEEEDEDGEIGEGEILGYQQDSIASDSDEMSDDESDAEEVESGDSDDAGKSD